MSEAPGDGGPGVLLVTAGLPPRHEGAGPLRAFGLASRLPDLGWRVTVLSRSTTGLSREVVRARREAGAYELPSDVRVVRVPGVPTPSTVGRRLLGGRYGSDAAPEPATDGRGGSRAGRLLRWAGRWIETPDRFVGWATLAGPTGAWVGGREEVDVVVGSGPPFSAALAAKWIARRLGVPFVLEVRDAWTLDPSDPHGTRSGSFRAPSGARRLELLRSMERDTLHHASAVVFLGHGLRDLYVDAFPDLVEGSTVIPHGGDWELHRAAAEPYERPTLAHVGTVHPFQLSAAERMIRAFALLRDEGRIAPDARVVLTGVMGPPVRHRIRALSASLGLEGAVVVEPSVTYPEAVDRMGRSHALALLDTDNPRIRLAKIADYVLSGAPMILAGASSAEHRRIVEAHGGTVLDADASNEALARIAEALAGERHPGHAERPERPPEPLRPYTRRFMAERFEETLRRAVGGTPGSTPDGG